MAQPYGKGTIVTHQARNSQGQPVGAAYRVLWLGDNGNFEIYWPVPPGPDDFKREAGHWNEQHNPPCGILANFELYYGPGATFELRQGELQTSHGDATAVA